MADVEIVATYELYNINRTKLENLIHRVFDPARLDIEIKDRFGNPVIPREWFLVPLFVDRRSRRADQGRHDHRLRLRPEGCALGEDWEVGKQGTAGGVARSHCNVRPLRKSICLS